MPNDKASRLLSQEVRQEIPLVHFVANKFYSSILSDESPFPEPVEYAKYTK